MKKLLLILALSFSALTVLPGCGTAPSARVVQVQTLKTVELSAKASLDTAVQLVKSGQITVLQWQAISDFYDNKLQPAFLLANSTAKADLSDPTSPQIAELSGEFLSLIASFAPNHK